MKNNRNISFKPKLLHIDEVGIERVKKEIKEGTASFELFVSDIARFSDLPITLKIKKKLLDCDWEFVMEIFRREFPFPKASDNFNLKAIGLDLDGLRRGFIRSNRLWKKYPYNLSDDGKLFIENMEELPDIKRYIFQTLSSKQNEALACAQNLKVCLEEMEEKGLLNIYNKSDIGNITSILAYGLDKKGELNFMPVWNKIREL
jgi:hypothetical protein